MTSTAIANNPREEKALQKISAPHPAIATILSIEKRNQEIQGLIKEVQNGEQILAGFLNQLGEKLKSEGPVIPRLGNHFATEEDFNNYYLYIRELGERKNVVEEQMKDLSSKITPDLFSNPNSQKEILQEALTLIVTSHLIGLERFEAHELYSKKSSQFLETRTQKMEEFLGRKLNENESYYQIPRLINQKIKDQRKPLFLGSIKNREEIKQLKEDLKQARKLSSVSLPSIFISSSISQGKLDYDSASCLKKIVEIISIPATKLDQIISSNQNIKITFPDDLLQNIGLSLLEEYPKILLQNFKIQAQLKTNQYDQILLKHIEQKLAGSQERLEVDDEKTRKLLYALDNVLYGLEERQSNPELKIQKFIEWSINKLSSEFNASANQALDTLNDIYSQLHDRHGVYFSRIYTSKANLSERYDTEIYSYPGILVGIESSLKAKEFFGAETQGKLVSIGRRSLGRDLFRAAKREELEGKISYALMDTDSLDLLPGILTSSLHFVANGDNQLSLFPSNPETEQHRWKKNDFNLLTYLNSLTEKHGENAVSETLKGLPGALELVVELKKNPANILKINSSSNKVLQEAMSTICLKLLEEKDPYYSNSIYIKKVLEILNQTTNPISNDILKELSVQLSDRRSYNSPEQEVINFLVDKATHDRVFRVTGEICNDLGALDLLLNFATTGDIGEQKQNNANVVEAITKIFNYLSSHPSFATEERLTKIALFTETDISEIKIAIEFSKELNHHQWENINQAINLSKIPNGLEAIKLLAEGGFKFDVTKHQEALPYLASNAKRLLPDLQELSKIAPDYPPFYDPKPGRFDPFISYWETSINLEKLNAVYSEYGEIPKKYSDALIYALKNSKVIGNNKDLEINWNPSIDQEKATNFCADLNLLASLSKRNPELSPFIQNDLVNIYKKIFADQEFASNFLPALDLYYQKVINAIEIIQKDNDFRRITPIPSAVCFNLFSFGVPALDNVNFEDLIKTPFAVCGLSKLSPNDFTKNEFVALCNLVQGNQQLLNNKYNIEYFTTFLEQSPEQQKELLKFIANNLSSLNRTEAKQLITLMSLVNSLKENQIQKELITFAKDKNELSLGILLNEAARITAKVLKDYYPEELVTSLSSENLLSFIEKYVTFEHTLNHFHRSESIPILRVVGIKELIELSDQQEKKSVEEYLANLNLKDQERERALQYLSETKDRKAASLILAADRIDPVVNALKDPHTKFIHSISEITPEDQLLDIIRQVSIYFDQHLPTVFKLAEQLDNTELSKELGLQGSTLNRFIRNQNLDNLSSLKKVFPECSQLDSEEIIDFAKRKFQEVTNSQQNLKEMKELRNLKTSLERQASPFLQELRSIRNQIATNPVSNLVEELGFSVHDSFQEKIFLGELKALKENLLRQIPNEQFNNTSTSQKLLDLINQAENISAKIDSYLGSVAADSKKVIETLSKKHKDVAELLKGIKESPEAIDDLIRDVSPNLFQAISHLQKEPNSLPEKIQLIESYLTGLNETQDLRNIISVIESKNNAAIYKYRFETIFSRQLEATKGQCLDYRTSKNSIGNSPYLLSLQDNIRSLVVAEDLQGVLRFDAIVYLAPVHLDGDGAPTPCLVADIPYTPDGTAMNWSKMEGYFDFLVLKAKEMEIPLVIPNATAGNSIQQIEDFAKDRNLTYQYEAESIVDIVIGPSGSTYLEIAGFRGYDHDSAIKTAVHILK